MEAYTDFAQVYDTFMDDTPYEEWCAFLTGLLTKYRADAEHAAVGGNGGAEGEAARQEENDISVTNDALLEERNTILDLGCGTGTLTELFAAKGYDMIGIDNSQEMLQIAIDKRSRSGSDILYLMQDMRSFELYGAVGAVISVCDSLNYLLEEEDVVQTFRLVQNYLLPGGVFLFDFNTVYKYETVIGDTTIAENREDCSFIWENYYHEAEQINEYDLTVFVREEREDHTDHTGKTAATGNGQAVFRRFQETHLQRGYTLAQMQEYLRAAGLVFVEALDADTHEAVTDSSERIYVAARKCGKKDGESPHHQKRCPAERRAG